LKRFFGAVCNAFFEVAFDPAHLIGHVGETKHRSVARSRESIESSRFHFDRENSRPQRRVDRFLRFAKGGAVVQVAPSVTETPAVLNASCVSLASRGSTSLYSDGRI
jgi:hypothetical protein